MRYITEMELRAAFASGIPEEYELPQDARLTPAARQYLTELRLYRPEESKPCFCAAKQGKKPEYMTHLTQDEMTHKNHPRIILRGRLDSLEAEILLVQIAAQREQKPSLVNELEDALLLTRRILAADVTGKPLGSWTLNAMTPEQVHEASHHPEQLGLAGHVLPSVRQGEIAALLNRLRTKVREVELAAVAAYCKGDGPCSREDLLLALNRLSSYFYVLQLLLIKQQG